MDSALLNPRNGLTRRGTLTETLFQRSGSSEYFQAGFVFDGESLASQSILTWNRIMTWLKEMNTVRQSNS